MQLVYSLECYVFNVEFSEIIWMSGIFPIGMIPIYVLWSHVSCDFTSRLANVKNVSVILEAVYKSAFAERGHLLKFTWPSEDVFSKQYFCSFPVLNNWTIWPGFVLMPTTRKQKKAKKSRGLEMLSDIKNLDIMLGENTREREGSLNSNLPKRSRSFVSNESVNGDEDIERCQRNVNSRTSAECDQNSATGNSSAEINRLSSELNSRISREMDEMMNSVSVQIQRALSDAISTQVLPQIQNAIMAGSGHETKKGWDAPSERPEQISEVQRNPNAKNSLRNKQDENQSNYGYSDLNVHDRHETHQNPEIRVFKSGFPQKSPTVDIMSWIHPLGHPARESVAI